jgi:23S rRNA (guanosine2251-2'-O)-methyltransferase
VSSNYERNDRKAGKKQVFQKRPAGRLERPASGPDRGARTADGPARGGRGKAEGDNFLWGRHPVLAALANPARRGMGRLMATEERAAEIERDGLAHGHRIEVVDVQALTRLLPAGAVHQGLAFKVQPLEGVDLRDLAEPAEGLIVMLDQLTDPQNVGAIFRSALAFGARGIVVQDRHAPALAGALAKAAVGATERLPHARVTNLSRALETLAEYGWRAVGLDGDADHTLEQALDHRPTVLVMGSEGDGVRRLVAEHCEVMAKIPMPGGFESLNVSNAAAVALYEAARAQRAKPAG